MDEVLKVLNIARNEEDYLEKSWAAYNENPEVIYDKTAGAGRDNVTKYAKEMDDLDVYNTPKQGYPWCKVFVDWCFIQALGFDRANELLYGWTAGVTQFYNWYKANDRIFSTPEGGDLIIFGDCDHIGFVIDYDDERVYTTEGNTSGASGLVANGGAVVQKSYPIHSSYIKCYARPAYEKSPEPSPQPEPPTPKYRMLYKGCSGDDVVYLQDKLQEKGYDLPQFGSDGYFGNETEVAVRELQADAGIEVDGIVGDNTWAVIESDFTRPDEPEYPGYLIGYGDTGEDVVMIQERLIELGYECGDYGADGIFGRATEYAVKVFQEDNDLIPDGIVGELTWSCLF